MKLISFYDDNDTEVLVFGVYTMGWKLAPMNQLIVHIDLATFPYAHNVNKDRYRRAAETIIIHSMKGFYERYQSSRV